MITITEALAELKTLAKRIEKKREFVRSYLVRQEKLKDPLGDSTKALKAERQAIGDLEERVVLLRRAIQKANEQTQVTVNGQTRSIAEWLIWRKEVAPEQQRFLMVLSGVIQNARNDAQRRGFAVVPSGNESKPEDMIINLDEKELGSQIEALEETLGSLDGQLSLKNATVLVEV